MEEKKTIELPIAWVERLNYYVKKIAENSNDSIGQQAATVLLLGYLDSLNSFLPKK